MVRPVSRFWNIPNRARKPERKAVHERVAGPYNKRKALFFSELYRKNRKEMGYLADICISRQF